MPSVDLSGGAGATPGVPGSPAPDYGRNYYSPGPAYSAQAAGAGGYGGGGGGYAAQAAGSSVEQEHLRNAAYDQAQQGFQAAREGASVAVAELHKYVQEGPAGISMLCFLGGMATTVAGVIGLLNLGTIFTAPFTYVLNGYLTLFGLVTFLLEADLESFKTMKVLGRFAPFVDQYQGEVFVRAKFLTELRGRGMYYLFVGSLAITQCFFCLFFLIGAWNVLMGMLCLLMSFGINPTENLLAPSSEHNIPLYNAPHGP